MRHYFFIFIFFFLSFSVSHAQTKVKTKLNALSFELGKTGLIYNISYDHLFPGKNTGLRVVAGSNFGKYLNAVSAGAGGYLLKGEKQQLELGVDISYLSVDEVSDDQKGFTLIYPDYSIKTFYLSGNIGYRKYNPKSLFRVGLSPGFIKNKFLPGAYISLGLRFQ